MSVNQESLSNSGLVGHAEDAPELEYVAVRQDSLTMFGAAIGGAILGMLLTLLVLAILNSGTLRFVGGASRLAQVETAYNQLSSNVGVNTANIDTLNANMGEQVQMLDDKIGAQAGVIDGINGSIAGLDESRGQFDTLVNAISGAIDTIKGVDSSDDGAASAGAADANAGEAAATDAAGEEAAAAEGDADAASSLSVLFFADSNGNEAIDAGEESLLGISVALVNADGETVATMESTDGGMEFADLAPGDYTLMVEDAGEYALASDELGTVTVGEGAEQSVFIAVGSE